MLAVESGRAEAAGVGFATRIVAAKHSNGKLRRGARRAGSRRDRRMRHRLQQAELKLGQAMEAALKALVADGTYDKIYEKW